jgi:hypothetical protein
VLTIGRMVTGGYSIQPLTAHTWNAFAGLVERHNGIFGGCWCIYFHPDCAEYFHPDCAERGRVTRVTAR